MGKIIITTLLVLSNLTFAFAQRDYSIFKPSDYKSDTIRMAEYSYVCDTLKGAHIFLYNATNHIGRGEVEYIDGTPISLERYLNNDIDPIVMSRDIDVILRRIVDNAFTAKQAENFDESCRLGIQLDISSTTGEVMDVYFSFTSVSNYTETPIEVFRAMELQFKNDVNFELTEEGKRLNYCLLSWSQCPKGREDSGMTIPEGGGGMLTMPGGKLNGTIGTPSTTPTMP